MLQQRVQESKLRWRAAARAGALPLAGCGALGVLYGCGVQPLTTENKCVLRSQILYGAATGPNGSTETPPCKGFCKS
eukprot:1589820-Pleurochrysis_carterae.AAC.1